VIVHARDARRGQIVQACSRGPYERGVRCGMPLAEATTWDPAATLIPHDVRADEDALTALARWCERFSPMVGVGPAGVGSSSGDVPNGAVGSTSADHLFLEATDLASHFGGEVAMVRQVTEAFVQRGYQVRVAMAGSPGAAWALARYATHLAEPLATGESTAESIGSSYLVVPAAASWSVLQGLPLTALRLPSATVALLHELGLRQVGQLAALPRSSLAVRFGPLLLQRYDQLLGLACEPLVVCHEPPQFQADRHLEHPVSQQAALVALLEPLIEQVAAGMRARGEGAGELVCRFRCTRPLDEDSEAVAGSLSAASHSLRVGLFQPTASAEHLLQLVQMQLAALVLPGAVEYVVVEATHTAPLARRQRHLFPDGTQSDSQQLAQLVDRLSSRLGAAAVVGAELDADVQPEQAYRYVPLTGRRQAGRRAGVPAFPSLRAQRLVRPLHLRSPPLPLTVLALVPNGPPLQFRLATHAYRVVRHWGPERIETGWWRGRSVRRDYYRVETERGTWCWLFRQVDDGQWFLHGWFG
jgi:protein ImuB